MAKIIMEMDGREFESAHEWDSLDEFFAACDAGEVDEDEFGPEPDYSAGGSCLYRLAEPAENYSPIPTNYDTVAARIDGVEHIAIPIYEDGIIRVFRLPSGGADAVRGLLTLPVDAAEVYAASVAGIPDAEAVYAECERILREEIAG
jgi:hypothetical protein